MTAESNRDAAELEKFDRPDLDWWDPRGPMQALHAIQPARFQYVAQRCALSGARALDVGCGGGLMTEAFARAGANATGIDLSNTALLQAREHARESALEIEYLRQDANALAQQRPQSFDLVVCMELLEHVPDFMALLADCAQLLRPDGSLFVSTLNRTISSFLFAIVGAEHLTGLLPVGTHRHDRFIRPSELAQAARDLGLQVEDLCGIRYHPLRRTALLGGSPKINYLVHLRPAGPSGP